MAPEYILNKLQSEAYCSENVKVQSKNQLFARLYFFTTKQWVKYAKQSQDPELLYFMVEHFYALYEDYVLQADQFEVKQDVPHWLLYQKIIGKSKTNGGWFTTSIALFFGIKAHTRYDLAEAICFAHNSYSKQFGKVPDSEHFHSLLFCKEANLLFRNASIDFIKSSIKMPISPSIWLKTLEAASYLWLPFFQGARKLAWKEARHSILTNKTIVRERKSS